MRRLAAVLLILSSAGCANVNNTSGVHDSSAVIRAEIPWKPGYAWGYRYETPRESGTFAWVMDREERLDGTTFYVMRSGWKEIYVRKSDFAYCMEKVDGEIVGRNVPPARFVAAVAGEKWEVNYVRETPKEHQTQDIATTCESSGPEKVTVPAGTFDTLKTTCTNSRTGELAYQIWYATTTRQMVRDRTFYPDDWRERELTDIWLKPRAQ